MCSAGASVCPPPSQRAHLQDGQPLAQGGPVLWLGQKKLDVDGIREALLGQRRPGAADQGAALLRQLGAARRGDGDEDAEGKRGGVAQAGRRAGPLSAFDEHAAPRPPGAAFAEAGGVVRLVEKPALVCRPAGGAGVRPRLHTDAQQLGLRWLLWVAGVQGVPAAQIFKNSALVRVHGEQRARNSAAHASSPHAIQRTAEGARARAR